MIGFIAGFLFFVLSGIALNAKEKEWCIAFLIIGNVWIVSGL